MATGRLMTFAEARTLGIVHEVWGDDELKGLTFADAVQAYARQFTPPHKASGAVGRMKRAVQSGAEAGILEGLSLERELQQLLFQSRGREGRDGRRSGEEETSQFKAGEAVPRHARCLPSGRIRCLVWP